MARDLHLYSLSEKESQEAPYSGWPRCAYCGLVFSPHWTGRPGKYGSDACKQKAHRTRKITSPLDGARGVS